MNKIDLQKRLDKSKWIESEKVNKDLSGDMSYCNYCQMQKKNYDLNNLNIISKYCTKSQEKREQYCLCSKAYRRMHG